MDYGMDYEQYSKEKVTNKDFQASKKYFRDKIDNKWTLSWMWEPPLIILPTSKYKKNTLDYPPQKIKTFELLSEKTIFYGLFTG